MVEFSGVREKEGVIGGGGEVVVVAVVVLGGHLGKVTALALFFFLPLCSSNS